MSTALTAHDKRYWGACPQVVAYIESIIPQGAKVLEIGPGDLEGRSPFWRADMFVDCADLKNIPYEKLIKCNVVTQPLPFPDKMFDFIYCRHVIEDLYDPFPILREMERVGKAGFIETPSPIAELTRSVDGVVYWRGYHHHHFFVWESMGELRMLSKYPVIEYMNVADAELANLLRKGYKYWNTYHLWRDRINYSYRQNVENYDMIRDYAMMLGSATKEAKSSIDAFWVNVPEQVDVPQLIPKIGSPIAA